MKAVELCQLRGAGGGGDTWHGATKFRGNIANGCEQSVSVLGRNVSGKMKNAQIKRKRGESPPFNSTIYHLQMSKSRSVLVSQKLIIDYCRMRSPNSDINC